jgi:hypothetical protein
VQHCKDAIITCSWLAGVFALGSLVFGSLWSGFSALGDVQGASVAEGTFWGFVICFGINGLALIGLLTATSLKTAPLPDRQPTKDN